MSTKRVVVVGLGYIGLPTAAAIATRGCEVVGVDVNPAVVDAINAGRVPFVEPDLAVAVAGAVAQGNLTATSEMAPGDAFLLAVPTPFTETRTADLSFVRAAAEAVAPVLKPGNTVILESTSPPGTTRQVSEWIGALRPDLALPGRSSARPDIHVAHCPERVLPGRIMIEMVTNDRIVGGLTPSCAESAADIYRIFSQGNIAITDAESAEMAKLVENSYRDVNIAFANEISMICDDLELDAWEVIEMANRHPRVNILNPGPGVGGHCIAVDPWFIVAAAPDRAQLIRTARETNDAKPMHVIERVIGRAARIVDPRIACLGLAFKADVDDLRESPSVQIVQELSQRLPQAHITVVEPHIREVPVELAGASNISLGELSETIREADLILLLVDHAQFKQVKRSNLQGKIVFDTRGTWR